MIEILYAARVRPNAVLPTRKHPADAGLDIYAAEAVTIIPHSTAIVPSGIKVDIPDGYVGLLKPKGRNDHLLGAGVVDAGYQGELLVKVANHLDRALEIRPGDAIGQLLILPVATPRVAEVAEEALYSKSSQRGAGGGIVSQYNQS